MRLWQATWCDRDCLGSIFHDVPRDKNVVIPCLCLNRRKVRNATGHNCWSLTTCPAIIYDYAFFLIASHVQVCHRCSRRVWPCDYSLSRHNGHSILNYNLQCSDKVTKIEPFMSLWAQSLSVSARQCGGLTGSVAVAPWQSCYSNTILSQHLLKSRWHMIGYREPYTIWRDLYV